MIEALIAFAFSLFLGWVILRFRQYHESLTSDSIDGGPQKIHVVPVPRIGGVMICVGFVAGVLYACSSGRITWEQGCLIVLCGMPAFAGGFFEDVTKHGGVTLRLLATFLSAGLAFWLLGARLDRLDFPIMDRWLAFLPISLLFTMFAAGGVSQSINIIDGLNGLAVFVGMTILAALGIIAWQVGDALVLSISLAACGGIAGFFVWNFPYGRIFCGDGGAYFIGFIVAEVSVLLVHRQQQVSAWFPLLLAAYPVWETCFSIYRRKLVSRRSAMRPDALHLHSLVYRWIRRINHERDATWRDNALSSALCWLLPMASALYSLRFWNETWILALGALGFAVLYVSIYRELSSVTNWRKFGRRRARRSSAPLEREMPDPNGIR
jgi:UDP-N-acetylmuramyl pentapeptide phosphotransferase/UDP-N-acetylglucosamine-1-phosphate transferase